jgi:hypothetical protein
LLVAGAPDAFEPPNARSDFVVRTAANLRCMRLELRAQRPCSATMGANKSHSGIGFGLRARCDETHPVPQLLSLLVDVQTQVAHHEKHTRRSLAEDTVRHPVLGLPSKIPYRAVAGPSNRSRERVKAMSATTCRREVKHQLGHRCTRESASERALASVTVPAQKKLDSVNGHLRVLLLSEGLPVEDTPHLVRLGQLARSAPARVRGAQVSLASEQLLNSFDVAVLGGVVERCVPFI